MKKISLILVICILLGCASLISCNFSEIFEKTSSIESTEPSETMQPSEQPTQPSEQPQPTEPTSSSSSTTEPQPEPEELVFEHGDNFTEEDIEFVKSLHGYKMMLYDPIIHTFSSMVTNVNSGRGYLYYANVDIDNPYYICAYFDWSVESTLREWGAEYIYVNHYVWYKFYDKESIPEKIDNLTLAWGYSIYDVVITKDIANNVEFEHKFKLYAMGYGGMNDFYEIYECMLMHYYEPIDQNTKFVEDVSIMNRYYKGYTTSREEKYFILKYCDVISADDVITEYFQYNKEYFEDYYDILYPYFERVEEADFEFTNLKGDVMKSIEYGINIEVLIEILFEN